MNISSPLTSARLSAHIEGNVMPLLQHLPNNQNK